MVQYQEATLFATSASSFILFESTAATTTQGLTLINTTSFSAVASQSINNVFTSTYENYKIIVNWTGSVDSRFIMRMRASGTDNSASNYFNNDISMLSNGSTVSGGNEGSISAGWIGYNGASVETSHTEINIFSPQNSTRTTGWTAQSIRWGGAVSSYRILGCSLSVTTSYDGFTLLSAGVGSPTITGVVSVYGVAK
jgi:hypothetical protein